MKSGRKSPRKPNVKIRSPYSRCGYVAVVAVVVVFLFFGQRFPKETGIVRGIVSDFNFCDSKSFSASVVR